MSEHRTSFKCFGLVFLIGALSITTAFSQIVGFKLGNECGSLDDVVKICATVDNFTDIVSIQGTVHYGANQATFVALSDYGLPGMNASSFTTTNPGIVTFSWFDATVNGVTLVDNDTIFCIDLEVDTTGTNSPVRFTSSPTNFEVVDATFSVLPFDTVPGAILSPSTVIDVIMSCQPYTWKDGITYSTSNSSATYLVPEGNVYGCDSILQLDLTIAPLDVSTTNSAAVITASEASASYRWLDCPNGFAVIPNETEQSFTAIENGEYAVEITQNECSDTSACVTLLTVGITSPDKSGQLSVYPNPSSNLVVVTSNSLFVELTDLTGMVLETVISQNGKATIDVSWLASGCYMVRTDSGRTEKILVTR